MHQLHDFLRDGQPQAAAAITPADGPVGLDKDIEQAGLLLVADAHPGVGDAEAQQRLMIPLAHQAHTDTDMAGLGELDRVAHQVGQHLGQTQRITHITARQ